MRQASNSIGLNRSHLGIRYPDNITHPWCAVLHYRNCVYSVCTYFVLCVYLFCTLCVLILYCVCTYVVLCVLRVWQCSVFTLCTLCTYCVLCLLRVWRCSVRPWRNAGITRLKLGCRPAAWRSALCRCSGRRASRHLRRLSRLSPWLPTSTTRLKSRAYDEAEDQSGRSKDSLSEHFLSLMEDSGGSSWSGDLPGGQEDNTTESLSLCRVSHSSRHPLTSVPVFYYKIKDFLDRRFLP